MANQGPSTQMTYDARGYQHGGSRPGYFQSNEHPVQHQPIRRQVLPLLNAHDHQYDQYWGGRQNLDRYHQIPASTRPQDQYRDAGPTRDLFQEYEPSDHEPSGGDPGEDDFEKSFGVELRQTEEASIGHRKRALPHHPLVSTKSVSTHQAIGFKTQNNILKHEVSLEQDIDESHRAADAGIWAQMGMPQDGPTRLQTDLSEENTPDHTRGARLIQERAAQKGRTDAKSKGQVREVAGGIEYFIESDSSWHPAVYHEDIRGDMIVEASLFGQYDHPRERGNSTNDVTSYLPSQKEWGPDRERNWPGILHRLERRELPFPDYDVGNLYYNGRVVLDLDNHPVLDYIDLPATLSTRFSGQYMEAITRLDPRISHNDFLVRMPARRVGRDSYTVRPPYSLSTIAMRMSRFRQEHGLLSWTKREGSKNIRDNVLSRLPWENIENNSILPPSLVTQATEVEAKEYVQIHVGTKRKRISHACPDTDEAELANKRHKIGSSSRTLPTVLEMPVLPQILSYEVARAPQAVRKRCREASGSENDDESSATKRQCRRSASLVHGVEGKECPIAPEVLVVPRAAVAPEARMVPETPKLWADAKEVEGTCAFEFTFMPTAEELEFLGFDEEIFATESTQREPEQRDCEACKAISTPPKPKEDAIGSDMVSSNTTGGIGPSNTEAEQTANRRLIQLPPSNYDISEDWFLEFVREDAYQH